MLLENESRHTLFTEGSRVALKAIKQPVLVASFTWGLMAFMPVGVNYAAFFLLWMAVLIDGQFRTRWDRLGHGVTRFAALAFLAWSLVALAWHFQPPPEG